MTLTNVSLADNTNLVTYQKDKDQDFPPLTLDEGKKATAEKTNKVAKEKVTTATFKSYTDPIELQTKIDELNGINADLAAKVDAFTKQLKVLEDKNKDLTDELTVSKDKVNILEIELEGLMGTQSLTASSIQTTETKNSVALLQDKLSELSKEIDADVKSVDEHLSKKSDTAFPTLNDKLAKYEQLHIEYQKQYVENEVKFRHGIDQRNSMSNHWNKDGELLLSSSQGKKYLNLLNQNYELIFNFNKEVKKLQFAYETLVKNDYRNDVEFNALVAKVDDKITKVEERIEKAKAAYVDLEEKKKKELLQSDYDMLSAQLKDIMEMKTKVDATKKSFFETIESEIKKSTSEIPAEGLARFETSRQVAEKSVKETLINDAKRNHELYINLRKWASPTLNEGLDALSLLKTELRQLAERALLHEIADSFNTINKIKGKAQQTTATLSELTGLYNDAHADLRAAHVKYYNLFDSYNESINALSAKILDVEVEKALKTDLEDYSINDFTTKKIVAADLIKSLTKQKELINRQKNTMTALWNSLLLRLYDTSNDLLALKCGGKISWGYGTGFDNPYIGIYNELNARPAKQKAELVITQSAKV